MKETEIQLYTPGQGDKHPMGVPAREKLYANFLLKIELTDTIVQRNVYFNVCHCGELNSTRQRHKKGFHKIGKKTP